MCCRFLAADVMGDIGEAAQASVKLVRQYVDAYLAELQDLAGEIIQWTSHCTSKHIAYLAQIFAAPLVMKKVVELHWQISASKPVATHTQDLRLARGNICSVGSKCWSLQLVSPPIDLSQDI